MPKAEMSCFNNYRFLLRDGHANVNATRYLAMNGPTQMENFSMHTRKDVSI